MEIIEAVIQEKERQIFLQGQERGLEKGQVFAINKMKRKGFSSEVIADILEIPLNSVEKPLKITNQICRDLRKKLYYKITL